LIIIISALFTSCGGEDRTERVKELYSSVASAECGDYAAGGETIDLGDCENGYYCEDNSCVIDPCPYANFPNHNNGDCWSDKAANTMNHADAISYCEGLGGHLPKEKVTPEIAEIRGIAAGEDSISPGRYCALERAEDLIREVEKVRGIIGGKPVGVKITAGHIEKDLERVLAANPDFITIDCRGGGTGSAPVFVKDNVCLPPVFALWRARKFLDAAGSKAALCVTGGFRDSTDIAKALADESRVRVTIQPDLAGRGTP